MKTAAGPMPKGIKFHFTPAEEDEHEEHRMRATVPGKGGRTDIGFLTWHPETGEVSGVKTHPKYLGRGVATQLWQRAHEVSAEHGLRAPEHSTLQFPDGAEWAKKVDANPPQDVQGQQPLIKRPRANATEMAYAPRPQHADLRQHLIEEHDEDPQFLGEDADLEARHQLRHQYNQGAFHLHTPQPTRKYALNDTVAPPEVDTLRDEECPVCHESDVYDGQRCPVCGFIAPPQIFRDPDLEKARKVDLRQDSNPESDDPQLGPGQMNPDQPGGGLIDPSQLGDEPDQAGGGPADAGMDPASENGQLYHPDQISPNGVPMGPGPGGEPGTADDGVPDLFCPACGSGFDAGAPLAQTTDPSLPTSDGPALGDPCPNCGQATLMTEQDVEDLGMPQPVDEDGDDVVAPDEADAEGPDGAEGDEDDLEDPDALPADDGGPEAPEEAPEDGEDEDQPEAPEDAEEDDTEDDQDDDRRPPFGR